MLLNIETHIGEIAEAEPKKEAKAVKDLNGFFTGKVATDKRKHERLGILSFWVKR